MGTSQDFPQLGHLLARHQSRLDRGGELAAMAGLRPFVTEQLGPRDRLGLGLRLARAVGAEHVQVQPRVEVTHVHDGLVAGRHAGHDVARERVLATAHLPAELAGELPRGLGVGVEADARSVFGRRQAAPRPGAVQPAADDPGARGVLAGQLLGGHGGDRPGAESGDRAYVNQRERLAVRHRGDADHPHHHGQPRLGVTRERGDPLEDREAGSLRRHRAEVAVRRGVEIGLRRHLPLVAGVLDEAVPDALDRLLGLDRLEDRLLWEHEDFGHGHTVSVRTATNFLIALLLRIP
jgi:hypothetical protein